MLEFLGSLGNIAGNIGKAAGPIEQIMAAIKGPKKPQAQPQPEAERYALSMLKALAEPGNSLVKALADEEMQNLQGGVQSDIRSKVLADRRERSMGRAPVFFDPERADENIAYQISRGTPMLRQQSQQNAIKRILEAAGVGNYAGAESDRWKNLQGQKAAREEGILKQGGISGRVGQGTDALKKILDIFKAGGQQGKANIIWDNPGIKWNQPASTVYG